MKARDVMAGWLDASMCLSGPLARAMLPPACGEYDRWPPDHHIAGWMSATGCCRLAHVC